MRAYIGGTPNARYGAGMIERLTDVPAGTIAFRVSGDVTADDYRQVLVPDLKHAAESTRASGRCS